MSLFVVDKHIEEDRLCVRIIEQDQEITEDKKLNKLLLNNNKS